MNGRFLRTKDYSGRMNRGSRLPTGHVRPIGSWASIATFLVLPLVPGHGCETATAPPAPLPAAPAAATPAPAPDAFASTVRPILRERCAPCHEPGGKLYAKLPFDDRNVVAAHPEGILKRLQGSDREAVEKWLRETKTTR